MTFESITDQPDVGRKLRAMLASERLPHACLFVGSAGTGRLSAARELARTVLCSTGVKRDAPCGQCADCRLFGKGNHPDYRESGVPEGKQSLPIEAVREVQRTAALRPVRAGRRVFVIRDADRMSIEAANSFLKTLEEPPGSCVFVLIASSLRPIPETILSRCRIVRFANLSPDILRSRLEAAGLEGSDARWLARRAWGSPGLAEQLRQQGLHDFNRELVARLHGLAPQDSLALSDWLLAKAEGAASSAAERRIAVQDLLECAALYYRDAALAAASSPAESDLCNSAARDGIGELAARTSADDSLDRAQRVLEAIERIGANANSRLVLDWMFTHLARPAGAAT